MSSKTRKLIWSVPLMATLAVVGALAVFVALGLPNANPAQAQFESVKPMAPTSVMATSGYRELVVTWTHDNQNVTNFIVQHKLSSAADAAYVDSAKGPASATMYTVPGLTNGLMYDVRVVAYNDETASDPSPSATETPNPTAPTVPQNLKVVQRAAGQVAVTWDAPETTGGDAITSYVVEHNGTGSFTTEGVTVDVSGRMATITGLRVGSVTIRVRASNGTQASTDAEETFSVDALDSATIEGVSDSPNGSNKVEIKVETSTAYAIGSSVILYLDDKFQVPDSIGANMAYITQAGEPSEGATIYARVEVDSEDDAETGDDSYTIEVFIPDMNPGDMVSPTGAADFTVTIPKSAGIKSPSEAGSYKYRYDIVTSVRTVRGIAETLTITPKIKLSDESGSRGKEVTIAASGFNENRKATAYVVRGLDSTDCAMVTGHADKVSLGSFTVGTDHQGSVAFEVTSENFKKGNNAICVRDDAAGDGQRLAREAVPFTLNPSLTASPATVNSGDEVTLKPKDFIIGSDGDLTRVDVASKSWQISDRDESTSAEYDCVDDAAFCVRPDDSDYVFNMPGGVSGDVEIKVTYTYDDDSTDSKTATITVAPSSLMLSKTEVASNESIVISGSGFSESSKIFASMILIDGKALNVDEAGTEGIGDDEHVVTTSSGQFTATVNIWHDGAGNPALDADTYTIKVTDENGYEGETTITILEPTVMVTPEVAGPRDYILITGANWPVTTSDDDNDVTIMVDDKTRSASIDSTGRFNYEYQLSGGIDIGAEHDIVVSFTTLPDIGGIEETITFSVPSSNVVITPPAAAPGQIIQLELSGMPIYERVNEVVIDGGNRLGGTAVNTDSEGDVTVTGIVIPFADPGFYPVKIVVGTGGSAETAIVQLEILAESSVRGAASPLPESVMDLGDSVVRIFHFNTRSKVWTFYDPREEFEGLNSLTELAAGQPYSILVSENVENVVLNGRTRDLTCVGDDCWNQLVW